MSRPVLLDLFSGAGGAAQGYHDAGFDVIGVDINPQPRYPFRFVQGDALDVLAGWDLLPPFDAIHASPPCQDHSSLAGLSDRRGTAWMLDATLRLLSKLGVPYVVENVPRARMPGAFTLCGRSFGIPLLKRHRQFVTSFPVLVPPCACAPGMKGIGIYGDLSKNDRKDHRKDGYPRQDRAGVQTARDLLGCPWMDAKELTQAIPPAYTRFVGEQLLAHLAAAPRPGPAPKPAGPTGPQPTHPPSMPPPAPAPAPSSLTVPARSVALVEAASMRRNAGTPARAGDLRGDLARAGTQTPAVVVGSGGGG